MLIQGKLYKQVSTQFEPVGFAKLDSMLSSDPYAW